MKQLSIRGFGKELEAKIKTLARSEGISLNKAILRLLRKGAGLDDKKDANTIQDGLDAFMGTWSEEEAREFEEAVSCFETIDPDFWS